MEGLLDRNAYEPLGLFDGEELVGYALMWLEPGVALVLLDYLGIVEGKRGNGLGARLLDLLAQYYSGHRGVIAEVEAENAADPEEGALQTRRLEFYRRSGYRYAGYDCALFGVHYRTLIRGAQDVSATEAMNAHQTIYKAQFPKRRYDRFIQIPLAPGEAPRPVENWTEEGEE
jgi:GNAT superfamily N-acetyltransferase